MLTHYLRKKPAFHQKLASPLESLLYHAIPEDRLVHADAIYASLLQVCKTNGERLPDKKAFTGLLASLVERGFVREIHGVRLERLLELV